MAEKRPFLIFVDSFLNFCKGKKLRLLGQFLKFLQKQFSSWGLIMFTFASDATIINPT